MKKFITYFLISVGFAFSAVAADDCIPQAPNPPRLVNDFANIIKDNHEGRLELFLRRFNDSTSTEIAIVTVNDLCDYEPSEMAYEIGEGWGVGKNQFDNGVVILVKPKQPNSDGEVAIATGYGLEGALPDALGKRIIENEMIPAFKNNDYTGGIVAAARAVVEVTIGEYTAGKKGNGSRRKKSKPPVIAILFVLFIFIMMLVGTIGRARRYGRKNNMGLWTALWLMGSMNNRHRGHFSDFSSGRGGFGGFGGGSGFGGFGGGSFGGGGASGSW